MPGRAIPHVSWLEMLSFDKFVHAGIFFMLVVLWIRAFCQLETWPVVYHNSKIIAVSTGIIYGGLLELMQSYCFSERSGDWYDFIANSFGCIMGVATFKKLQERIPFFYNPKN